MTPGGPTGGGAAPQPCDPVPELPSNGSQAPERGHVAAAAHTLTGETHLGLEKLTRDGVSERGPKTKWPGSEPPRKRPGPLERKRKGQGRGSCTWLRLQGSLQPTEPQFPRLSNERAHRLESWQENFWGRKGEQSAWHPSTSSAGVGRHVPCLAQGHPSPWPQSVTPPTHSRLSGLDVGSRYPEILPLQLTSPLWKWLGSATVSTHVATPLLEQGLVLARLGRSS